MGRKESNQTNKHLKCLGDRVMHLIRIQKDKHCKCICSAIQWDLYMLIFGIICILIIGQDTCKQIFKRKILIISESLFMFFTE